MGRRRDRLIALAVAAIGFVLVAHPAAIDSNHQLFSSFEDDAFYYCQVARNVADGRGFSFDGVEPTNGFQPGWELLMVPIFYVVPGRYAPLRAIIVLEGLLVGAAALLLYLGLRRRLRPLPALVAPSLLLGLPGAMDILGRGMESALVVFSLIAGWYLFQRMEEAGHTRRRLLVIGIVCALAFLARLEAGALALAVIAALWLRNGRRLRWREVALVAAPPLVVAAGYFAWNLIAFDSLLPVSGAVKLYYANHMSLADKLEALTDLPWIGKRFVSHLLGWDQFVFAWPWPARLACYALQAAAAIAAVIYRRAIVAAVRDAGVGVLLFACLIMVATDHVALRIIAQFGWWYHAPLLLATAVAVAVAVDGRRRLAMTVVAAAVVLAGFHVVRLRRHATTWAERMPGSVYRIGVWIDTHLPEGAVVGSFNAGALGYMTSHRVVNLDGLANSRRYFDDVIRGGGFAHYLVRERIQWIADTTCKDDASIRWYLRLLGRPDILPALPVAPMPGYRSSSARCAIGLRRVDVAALERAR